MGVGSSARTRARESVCGVSLETSFRVLAGVLRDLKHRFWGEEAVPVTVGLGSLGNGEPMIAVQGSSQSNEIDDDEERLHGVASLLSEDKKEKKGSLDCLNGEEQRNESRRGELGEKRPWILDEPGKTGQCPLQSASAAASAARRRSAFPTHGRICGISSLRISALELLGLWPPENRKLAEASVDNNANVVVLAPGRLVLSVGHGKECPDADMRVAPANRDAIREKGGKGLPGGKLRVSCCLNTPGSGPGAKIRDDAGNNEVTSPVVAKHLARAKADELIGQGALCHGHCALDQRVGNIGCEAARRSEDQVVIKPSCSRAFEDRLGRVLKRDKVPRDRRAWLVWRVSRMLVGLGLHGAVLVLGLPH